MLVTDVQTHTHTYTFFHPITESFNENCLRRILTKLIFGRFQGFLWRGSKKTDPKSRYFANNSDKWIWIICNIGLNQLYLELNQKFCKSWFKHRKISGFKSVFFQCIIGRLSSNLKIDDDMYYNSTASDCLRLKTRHDDLKIPGSVIWCRVLNNIKKSSQNTDQIGLIDWLGWLDWLDCAVKFHVAAFIAEYDCEIVRSAIFVFVAIVCVFLL